MRDNDTLTEETASQGRRVEVYPVEGMHCGACSSAVERALNRVEGVQAAVSLPAETASVRFVAGEIAFEVLERAVADAGFRLVARNPLEDRA
ncbi:MAG: heavy metal-associated domain-containing protein, partial [Gemmatimonadota bacterium]